MATKSWHVATLCVMIALIWQWVVADGYFHGDWSGFFFAGDRFQQSPPVKAEGNFVLANSNGYDAQFYHAIAHDPLDLHGTSRFIDSLRELGIRPRSGSPPAVGRSINRPGLAAAIGAGMVSLHRPSARRRFGAPRLTHL